MHPDFLSDDISRRVLLSRIGINSTKEYESITSLECSSLVENDIPYFTCNFSEREVWCNGQEREGMLKEAPMQTIEKKISEFSQKDLQQQIHYIRMGYRLKESNLEADISNLRFAKRMSANRINEQTVSYVDFAKKVADYLIDYSLTKIALENTLDHSIGCTSSYCHGDIGNLEIIYRAAVLSNSKSLLERCKLTYDRCLTKSLINKYDGKAFRGGDVVGLMLGSAGFGYSALRFAEPKEVKSLLSLRCD